MSGGQGVGEMLERLEDIGLADSSPAGKEIAVNITAPNNQHTIPGTSHHGPYDHWTVLVPAGTATDIKLPLGSIAVATPLIRACHPGYWLSAKVSLVG